MRQRNTVAEHGADDRFTLHHRSMKLRIDEAFLQQLLTQFGEQRLLIHRRVDHPEMGGIEVLIQHPRTGAVHQHQLADLIQLIVSGERRDGHYRLVFFADPHRGDNKIRLDRVPLFVLALGNSGGDLQLRIFALQDRLNHPHHRIAGIAHQQHLRLTLVADVVVALQPDADMQHQKTDFVFANGIRRVFAPAGDRGEGHIPGHRVVLFDVIQQRIGDHDLVAHPGDHGFNVGQQIGMQLGVVQQVVIILAVNVAQDVIDQRFIIVGADSFRIDILHLTGRDMHA